MRTNLCEERKNIPPCHGHFSGILGEILFNFLIKEKWIQKDEKEFSITENGWNQLEILGLDIEKLRSNKGRIVAECIEGHYGIFFEHTGAYLGSFLANWLIDSGWVIKKVKDQYGLTKKGLQELESLGFDMKCFNESTYNSINFILICPNQAI